MQQTVSGFLRKDVMVALRQALTHASTADNACMLAAELACSHTTSGTFDATGAVCLLLDEYARWHAVANLTLVARIADAARTATGRVVDVASAALCELVLLVMVDVLAAGPPECRRRDQMRRMTAMASAHAMASADAGCRMPDAGCDAWPREALAWSALLRQAVAARHTTQALAAALHVMSKDRGKLCTWLPRDAAAVPVPESVAMLLGQRSHRMDPIWYAWSTALSLSVADRAAGATDPADADANDGASNGDDANSNTSACANDKENDERREFVEHSLRIYATCYCASSRAVRMPLLWYALRVLGQGAAPHVPPLLGVPILDDPTRLRQAARDFTSAVIQKLAPALPIPVLRDMRDMRDTRIADRPSTRHTCVGKITNKKKPLAKKAGGSEYLQIVVRVDPASTADRLAERARVYAAACESVKTAGVRAVVSRMP